MAPPRDLIPAQPGRIRPSRFVAGIALHLAVPAYLLWLAVALFPALTATPLDYDRLAATAGRASLLFLAVYTTGLIVLTLATRALEPALRQSRRRREARDPRAGTSQSQARLAGALRAAAALGHTPGIHQAILRLQAAPWRHHDPRFQTLSADLARATAAFDGAIGSAGPAERAELQELAARTLGRIAEAAEQLAEEQRQLDHGDARTLARYIELRYPSTDFASGAND
jgi:hypothetical protein